MELYKGKYWDVIFGVWCQDHPGYCIISSDKESLSNLSPEEWQELGKLEKELERVCKKIFGGVTGDLAGFFLQICELAVLAALMVTGKILF